MKTLYILIIFSLLTGCGRTRPSKANSELFEFGNKITEITNKKLDEVSGIAVSVNNPGHFWVHNDSGNPAEVYLVDEKLNIKLTCSLENVSNRDWEDMTIGPGPEENKTYLYIGDIGDNLARNEYKMIYRFEEPVLQDTTMKSLTISKIDRITVKLSDEKKDSEALMINPKTKNLYLVSKRENPVYLYEIKYPYADQDTVIAQSITSLPVRQIVAADFSADGSEVLMKNYLNVYYWKIDADKSLADTFKEKPLVLNYKEEPQGESIAFARDGSGYYTMSEKLKGEKSYLIFYKRKAVGH